MRDVPVTADDDLAPVGGGALAQALEVGEELAHEADLLVLPLGADLSGRQIERGHRHTRQVGLDIAPAVVELTRPETDLDAVGLATGVQGDTGPALGGGGRVHDVPAVRCADLLGQLPRLGAHLLQAQHIGLGTGEPLHETLLRGGPQPVHIHRGHSEHPGTIPAHWNESGSGPPLKSSSYTVFGMHIRRVSFDHPDAVKLNDQVQAEYGVRYGDDGDATPLAPADFYLIAYDALGVPVASGGWRAQDENGEGNVDGDAELKRMYVVEDMRGRGLARRILAALEEDARAARRRRMVLETGARQPEAVALYTSSGYEPCAKFGYYRFHELSMCFAKPL